MTLSSHKGLDLRRPKDTTTETRSNPEKELVQVVNAGAYIDVYTPFQLSMPDQSSDPIEASPSLVIVTGPHEPQG